LLIKFPMISPHVLHSTLCASAPDRGPSLQEAFPTLIRGRAFLLAMLFGRVASIFASYLSYFQKVNFTIRRTITIGTFRVRH
jgi:hypothetical protein